MKVILSAKNLKLTKALREYVHEKFSGLQKYFDQIIEVDINLTHDKHRSQETSYRSEVVVWADGIHLRSSKRSNDTFGAVTGAALKIESQLKKYKQKLRGNPHRRGGANGKSRKATHKVLEVPDSARTPPRIVRSNTFAMKPMSVEEAAMQLETLKQDFVVFSNAETEEVNVVYRRRDGNIGLIEPELR